MVDPDLVRHLLNIIVQGSVLVMGVLGAMCLVELAILEARR